MTIVVEEPAREGDVVRRRHQAAIEGGNFQDVGRIGTAAPRQNAGEGLVSKTGSSPQ